MSEAISQPELQAEEPPAEFQRPGSEEFFEGAVPDPHDVAIEDINPMSGRLFSEDKHWGFFERLRNESPVHFNETELAGRYWSLSRYEDIKKSTRITSDSPQLMASPWASRWTLRCLRVR